MKLHLRNGFYGVVDYAVFPLGMLVVAPVVLHRLGPEQYGLWALAISATSIGGIVASGFGDANIQRVATLREQGHAPQLAQVVRNTLTIHLALGILMAAVGWALARPATERFTAGAPQLADNCLLALRLASVLMLVRAIESVCIGTQRAYQRYGIGLWISLLGRVLSLAAAALLSLAQTSVAAIVASTLIITAACTVWQMVQLAGLLQVRAITPAFDAETFRGLFRFGIYSWLQAVASIVFGQVDRIFLGLSLGVQTVAAYTLCLQISQPLFGVAAAGLHFLFPYLAARSATSHSQTKPVLYALLANAVLVGSGALLLSLFGRQALAMWASPAIAETSAHVLPLIVLSTALTGMGVTATYTLLAMGRAHTVTFLTLGGGIAMLCLMSYLLPRYGVEGLAAARLVFGAASALLYLPLLSQLRVRNSIQPIHQPACEDV